MEETELFERAMSIAVDGRRFSTSLIQRRLGIGYVLAKEIADRAVEGGYISRVEGKPHEFVMNPRIRKFTGTYPPIQPITKPAPNILPDTESLVCADINSRQKRGLEKYGTSVAENPLPLREWLQHAYEETLDKAIYLKRAMQEIDSTMIETDRSEIDRLRAALIDAKGYILANAREPVHARIDAYNSVLREMKA